MSIFSESSCIPAAFEENWKIWNIKEVNNVFIIIWLSFRVEELKISKTLKIRFRRDVAEFPEGKCCARAAENLSVRFRVRTYTYVTFTGHDISNLCNII